MLDINTMRCGFDISHREKYFYSNGNFGLWFAVYVCLCFCVYAMFENSNEVSWDMVRTRTV